MSLNEFNGRNTRSPTPQRTPSINEEPQHRHNNHTLNSSSLEYQEVNYSQQNRNQRLLNTLENQDHLVIRALYQKDLMVNLGTAGNMNNVSNKVNMKVIGPSYDKGYSMTRAKHGILKAMVDKD